MLGRRRRRRANIKEKLGQRLVFDVNTTHIILIMYWVNSVRHHIMLLQTCILEKTLYNRTINSPQNVKSLSVLSPGIGSWN